MTITNTIREFKDQYYNIDDGLKSGELYYIVEDGSLHVKTSDITGELEEYEFGSPKSDGITLGYEGVYDVTQDMSLVDWIKTGFFEMYISNGGPEWANVIYHAKVDNESNIITITKCFTKENINVALIEDPVGLVQFFKEDNGTAYRTCLGSVVNDTAEISLDADVDIMAEIKQPYDDMGHQCWSNAYPEDQFPYTIVYSPDAMREEDVDFNNIIKVIIG